MPRHRGWHALRVLTRRQLLAWFCALEDDSDHPGRYDAMRNGQRLVDLAGREGLVSQAPQGMGEFARCLAQLKDSGYVGWDWQRWPSGTRDADEPPINLFAGEHLQRCD